MHHTLRFVACDDDTVLLEEQTIAYGMASGYERSAEELRVPPGSRVRVELLDHLGHLMDWRTYLASEGGQAPHDDVALGTTSGAQP